MNNSKCPCYGCNDRSITCHSECEKYIDWKTEHDAERERIRQERELNRDFTYYKDYAIQKVRNRNR